MSSNTAPTALHLLVVDDDPLSTAFQAHLASLLGHQATIQSDPVQSIEQALTGTFDVMLLDLGMPRMDGFDVLRQLRDREAAEVRPPLPVIAVTGYASEADRLRCLAAGFNEHMSKPIQASSLAAAVQRVVITKQKDCHENASDADRLRATVQRLNAVKPEDHAFAPTVTESFALRSAQLIEAMRGAGQRKEIEALKNASQALKSSAEFLGALHLAQMCADFQATAESGDWTLLDSKLETIDHEHQAVLTLLFESSR